MDGDRPLHRWHPFLSSFSSLSDHTVINFHGVDTVRQYILTLINIVRWRNVKDKMTIFSQCHLRGSDTGSKPKVCHPPNDLLRGHLPAPDCGGQCNCVFGERQRMEPWDLECVAKRWTTRCCSLVDSTQHRSSSKTFQTHLMKTHSIQHRWPFWIRPCFWCMWSWEILQLEQGWGSQLRLHLSTWAGKFGSEFV